MDIKSKTEIQILQHKVANLLIGSTLNCGISKPVPVVTDKNLFLRYLVYGSAINKIPNSDKIDQKILAPHKWIELKFLTGELTKEVDLEASSNEFSSYPSNHSELKDMNNTEYGLLVRNYEELYIEIIMAYFLYSLTGEDMYPNDRKNKFNKMFKMLCPEVLISYYNTLNPDFFNWLQ